MNSRHAVLTGTQPTMGAVDVGSSPTTRAIYAGLAQLVERQFCKLDVVGSIPATGTIYPYVRRERK